MNKAVAEEFHVFLGKEIKPDDWLWCSRCHRCYRASEFRKTRDRDREQIFLLCHYRDCDGDLPLDSRPWGSLIAGRQGFPKNPQRGKIYEVQAEFRPKLMKLMRIESSGESRSESL